MRDQLLGQAQPMLSILLDPGESVTGEASRFAWMTDSIEMAVTDERVKGEPVKGERVTGERVTGERVTGERVTGERVTDERALSECVVDECALDEAEKWVYTATGEPGVVAFASMRPSHIVAVEVASRDGGYLVRRSDLMARTPSVELRVGPNIPAVHGLALCRISGSGRAWVGLAGDVVRRELTAGQSLRAHPEHVGMFSSTVVIQVTQVAGISSRSSGYPCAVLSGPGVVWLQSMPSATKQ
jgi:uncharacterized protein (AIM24 family)